MKGRQCRLLEAKHGEVKLIIHPLVLDVMNDINHHGTTTILDTHDDSLDIEMNSETSLNLDFLIYQMMNEVD